LTSDFSQYSLSCPRLTTRSPALDSILALPLTSSLDSKPTLTLTLDSILTLPLTPVLDSILALTLTPSLDSLLTLARDFSQNPLSHSHPTQYPRSRSNLYSTHSPARGRL
jgi:hypothetical protein